MVELEAGVAAMGTAGTPLVPFFPPVLLFFPFDLFLPLPFPPFPFPLSGRGGPLGSLLPFPLPFVLSRGNRLNLRF